LALAAAGNQHKPKNNKHARNSRFIANL